jgi:hypothetical protein
VVDFLFLATYASDPREWGIELFVVSPHPALRRAWFAGEYHNVGLIHPVCRALSS